MGVFNPPILNCVSFPLTLNGVFNPLILNLLKDGRKSARIAVHFFPLILNLLKDGRKGMDGHPPQIHNLGRLTGRA